MAKISIDPAKTKPCITRLEDVARNLKELSGTLDDIRGNLGYKIAGQAQILARLRDVSGQIVREETAVRSMRDGLERILERYRQTEDANLGNVTAEENAQPGTNGVSDDLSASVFGENNSYIYTPEDGSGINFHKGEATQPRWEAGLDYDNFYPYDPTQKPIPMDYAYWAGGQTLAPLYTASLSLPDALRAYQHYTSNTGTPLEIDYERAYREDSVIAENVDRQVNNTNQAVRDMIAKGEKLPFSITSELISISQNPKTENWQKTIGRHKVWLSADVKEAEDGSIIVTTTVHAIDRYNFNKNEKDIATGLKDAINGRFEVLGWAKSFDTHGEIVFETNLSNENAPVNPDGGSSGRGGGRFGTREDRRDIRNDRRDSDRR